MCQEPRNYLNKIIEERHLSYRQLSRMSGIAYSTIYKIANYNEDPRQTTMIAISRALKLPVNQVFILEEKGKN